MAINTGITTYLMEEVAVPLLRKYPHIPACEIAAEHGFSWSSGAFLAEHIALLRAAEVALEAAGADFGDVVILDDVINRLQKIESTR